MPRSDYQYTDFYCPGAFAWERIKLTEIDLVVKKRGNVNVFILTQRFKSGEYAPRGTAEEHWCPIYFDFDGHDDVGVEQARKDVITLLDHLTQLSIPSEYVRIWFSGNRGFHLTVEPEIFGAAPDLNLTYAIKLLCYWFGDKLSLSTMDRTIYTRRRQWRLPNSVHGKSKLYCIELDTKTIRGLTIDQIRELAKTEQPVLYTDDDFDKIEVDPILAEMFAGFKIDADALLSTETNVTVLTKEDGQPPCIEDLLEHSIRRAGERNRGTVVLASYYRDLGIPRDDAIAKCIEWAKKIPTNLTRADKRELTENTRSVVSSVYAGDYHFLCNAIRALGSDKRPMACSQRECPVNPKCDYLEIDVNDIIKPEHVGQKVTFGAVVAGKAEAPFSIPRCVNIRCFSKGAGPKCALCRLEKTGQKRLEFNQDDERLLEFIGISGSQRTGLLKGFAGVPSLCHSSKCEDISSYSAFEIPVAPRIVLTQENMAKGMEYVLRSIVYVGDQLETNREYKFKARPLRDPRNQKSLTLTFEAEPVQSDLDVDKKPSDDLKIFQASEDTLESCNQKLADLYDKLSISTLRIYGRFDLFIAYHLTFCSPIGFMFDGDLIKGWMDMLVLGDSAQGKTAMLERMMIYYQAGRIVSGETAKRTGLVYSMIQLTSGWLLQWGEIPRNDRRLVAIDEAHELPVEEIGKMSRMRASGVSEATGVITAQTPARTRLIAIANPKYENTDMASLNYGVLGVPQIYERKEDVRRLDFAITVATGDVPRQVLATRNQKIDNPYTSSICAELIRFAWTRRPAHILVGDDTVVAILDVVTRLLATYSPKIPLVEPGDLRYKVARIAAATAVALFSVDETGKNVVVKPCHAEVAFDFLNRIYSAPSMGFDIYSETVKEQECSVADTEEIGGSIENMLQADMPFKQFVSTFLAMEFFQRKELAERLGLDSKSSAVDSFMRICTKHSLLRSTRAGYRKTAKFIKILKEFIRRTE
jgi:hypothetical protein